VAPSFCICVDLDPALRAGADALSEEQRRLVELGAGRQYVLRRVTDKYSIDLLRLESKHSTNGMRVDEGARDAGHPRASDAWPLGDENTVSQS